MAENSEYTPEEAERRAQEVARRLLNTPWKPRLTKKQEAERAKQAELDRASQPSNKVGNR